MENPRNALHSVIKEVEKSHYIICLGASAGGMEAIHEIFDNIPADTGFSFIVIQHLSSDHKSLMGELLSKHTSMNVVEAKEETVVNPNTIYIIPNNRNITIVNTKLLLSHKEEGRSPNMAIDIFLYSLAEDVGNKSIAVILSGTGSDGTKGIGAIKKAGGLVFVQDPTTAKFDGMPNSAIASGQIDFILSPESIAEELLTQYKSAPKSVIVDSLPEDDEPILQNIFDLIHSRTSSNFRYYKRPTLIRRLTRRLSILNKSITEYLELLHQNIEEVNLLRKEFLIGVTKFFRDPKAFEELNLKVIPEILKFKNNTDTIKIWVAGCSTGEEAYSIAILVKEHFNRLKIDRDIKIFASDTNKDAIEFASKGCYSDTIVNDVPVDILEKYFIKEDKKYRVVPLLRKMIVFSHHDLLKDAPFGKLDLICCRNMLIYVAPSVQSRILAIFHFSLNLGGYLFLGPSEHIGDLKDNVVEINKKWKIYKNSKIAKSIGLNPVSYSDTTQKRYAPSSLKVSKEISRKVIVETVLNKVMEECMLAGALVDLNCNIIETFGDYRKYLQLPEKKFDNNLLKMLPAKASILIGTTFRKAIHNNEKCILKHIKIIQKNPLTTVTIKPFHDNYNILSVLVLFNEEGESEKAILEAPNTSKSSRMEIAKEISPDFHDFLSLESELRETKEVLQKAIEDSETSFEEVQSSNEELISSNEELQSANEELQSLNEELHTVNAENQLRIKEIIDLNDDLNNYFRNTDIGQIFLDNNLSIRKFTPAATPLVNLIDSDIGRPLSHISNNISYAGLIEDVNYVLKTSEPVSKVIHNNSNTWYQMKIQPYLREGRIYDGAVLTFVDITAVKNAEDQVEKVNRELKELNHNLLRSNKELEQFAYITSHDLQEPLRKIQTFVELTNKNLSNGTVPTRYLDKINTSAIRMSTLIKDVLSYSRLTSTDEGFVETDLNETLNTVIADLDLLIEEKKAIIKSENLPIVKGIPLQLQQLFSNLISNSLKFCEQEPIIEVSSVKASPEEIAAIPELNFRSNYYKLIFKDNGIGFDQQYESKIFTIFQRLNHRNLYAGTGIGLALCKRIVENHYGAIFAKSALNCGATFEIYLPY